MNVLVVADGHYYQTPDGNVYVESVYDYGFYKRYLSVFEHVYAVARIEKVDARPFGKKISSGEGVSFLALPSYTGPIEYLHKYISIKKCVHDFCKVGDCAIFRIPAATSNSFFKPFLKTQKPFAVELVVDPWENFAPGSIDSVLRPLIRISWTRLVKKMCKTANGASYVTTNYLQSKYPCKAHLGQNGFTASYSSVELPDDSYAQPRVYTDKTNWVISHVANSFSDNGKGHVPLMKAVSLVREKGYDVSIRFIGDGPKMQEFKNTAKKLNIDQSVVFLGRLPSSKEVRQVLSDSDMFVFPTKAEGLPRGLLEAMSEALPCISSPTCGIPEVLDKKFMYSYDDYEGFANCIIRLISNVDLMTEASKRNLEVSKRFSSNILNNRRKEFYSQLAQCVKRNHK